MILGIDASNIRAGGGVTHLREVLAAAEPGRNGFGKVIVWAGSATLAQLVDRDWLSKRKEPALDRSVAWRAVWQSFRLGGNARAANCDVLFVPGGSFATSFRPIVTMSQNLLPFQWRELRRYGLSAMMLKMIALRMTQSRSFRAADATIFLTEYARQQAALVTGELPGLSPTIPHGIDRRFVQAPRPQRSIAECSDADPFRLIYVSAVEPYKHQWNVAKAVASLRAAGMPVTLDLIGPANPAVRPHLEQTIAQVDPAGNTVRYLGAIPHDAIHTAYQTADMCVFASSCETIANILIEGMAAGLPTASSNAGAMLEILGDAGVYFDPESPTDIAAAIKAMIEAPELRAHSAQVAYERSQQFSWQRCANETFSLLGQVARAGSRR